MATLPELPESEGPGGAILLQRRMIGLNLDVGAWARFEPGIFGGMLERCVACRGSQPCADDLLRHSDDPTWTGWRDYCPNATKLEMLVALQFF